MSFSSDIAFTPTVKQIQSRKGSRRAYANQEASGSWATLITPDIREFIEAQTSVFLGTANAQGQPYIQHRGGPAGFLRVIDATTLGFVDFAGNRQFISQGNLADNPQAFLFLIDYAHGNRVKIWGSRLMPAGYRARPEQVLLFTVAAWDMNCPQHIPRRIEAADVVAALTARDARIAALEAEVATLKGHDPSRTET